MTDTAVCLNLINFLSGRTKEAQSTVFEMLERNLGDKLRLTLSNMELSSNSDPSISGFSIAKLFYRPIQGYVFLDAFYCLETGVRNFRKINSFKALSKP